jgi:hypothetical protein
MRLHMIGDRAVDAVTSKPASASTAKRRKR